MPKKSALPKLSVQAKPEGLTFRTLPSAKAKFDPSIKMAKSADPVGGEIDILGEIGYEDWGGTSAAMVKTKLKAIGNGPVLISLNSPGGDAFEGIAIYNVIREHPGQVTVRVLGLAASAASIVAMAGDRIEMAEASIMMIHSSWGVAYGNSEELKQFADVLDKIDDSVADLYARRTGMKKDDVTAMMSAETWMSCDEAVEHGFADIAVHESGKKKNAKASAQVSAAMLAASGAQHRPAVSLSANRPGASGNPKTPKGKAMPTPIREQISSFEAKRAANQARMDALMSLASDEGRTLHETETQEYDNLVTEVDTIDSHLVRLKAHEVRMVANATQVAGADPAAGAAARAVNNNGAANNNTGGVVSVRSNVPPGTGFTRYVKALAMSKGNLPGALAIAQNNRQWMDQTPQVATVLMAAVAAGDTTTAGWAAELVYNQNLVEEFLMLLRPKTIIGQIANLTKVPFNVRIGSQSSGSSGSWVGQGSPVPVSKLGVGAQTLGIAKAAGLVVLDQELVRSSSPSAEALVQKDLIDAIRTFLDVQFIAPDYAAVANVSPASITNGVNPTAATGTTSAALRTDIQTLFGVWIAANLDARDGVFVMTPTTALAISLMLNALGQPVFPTMTPNGGIFMGLPVVVSNSAVQVGSPVAGEGNMIVLLHAPSIALADDGLTTIEASGEASIQMLDNPTNASTSGTTATTMVSMFQTNSIAIRAVRFINWAKLRSQAVAYIKDAMYVT